MHGRSKDWRVNVPTLLLCLRQLSWRRPVRRSARSNTIVTCSFSDPSAVHSSILFERFHLTFKEMIDTYWHRFEEWSQETEGEQWEDELRRRNWFTFGDGYDVSQSRNSGFVFSAEKSSQIFSNVCIQLEISDDQCRSWIFIRSFYLTAKWQFCKHTQPPSLCACWIMAAANGP